MVSSVKGRDNKPKHTWWYKLFMQVPIRCFLLPIGSHFLNIKTTKYEGKLKGPFLLLYNHSCDYDFVGVLKGVPGYYRFVMSDEIIKKRYKRVVVKSATNGIYRRKGESAQGVAEGIRATLDMGIGVCMAPEGQETPNGVSIPVRKKTGQLIKDMNVDVVTYRLEGGYGFLPKWTSERSKGPLLGSFVNYYKKEQLAEMTPDEINELLNKDLYFSFYDWNRKEHLEYPRTKPAECVDRIIYTCPKCNAMHVIRSKVDEVYCEECGYKVKMNIYGFFEGEDMVFDNIYDWDVWQKDRLKEKLPEWQAEPDKVITSTEGGILKRMNGDDQEILDEGVTIEITYNDVIIRSDRTNMRFPLMDLEGLTPIAHGIGVSYGGEFYKVWFAFPDATIRFRTIRRIIMNESVI